MEPPLPSGAEYRRFPRFAIDLQVFRRSGEQFVEERIVDVSKGGLSLATRELLRPGQLVQLVLAMPDGSMEVPVQGQVKSLRSVSGDLPYRAGLELANVDVGVARTYEDLLFHLLSLPGEGDLTRRVQVLDRTFWRDGHDDGSPHTFELVNIGLDGALVRGPDVPEQGTRGALMLEDDGGAPLEIAAEAVRTLHTEVDDQADLHFIADPTNRANVERVVRRVFLSPRVVRPPRRDLGSGIRVGDFEVGELLGFGGMCEVYRGKGIAGALAGQAVALKRLRFEAAALPGVVDRFLTEADLGRMLAHPNVVAVRTGIAFADEHWIAMELVEGTSLAHVLAAFARAGRLPPVDVVVSTAVELLAALDYCHRFTTASGRALAVVHGDVTPSNVLLARDGAVKLTDFGAASTTLPERSDLVGVPAKLSYLAPELYLDGSEPTPQVDLYQAGVLLYEALTGVKPFKGDTPEAICQAARRGPVPPSRFNAAIPPRLDAAILAALHANPRKRPESAAALRDELAGAGSFPLGAAGAERRTALLAIARELERG